MAGKKSGENNFEDKEFVSFIQEGMDDKLVHFELKIARG